MKKGIGRIATPLNAIKACPVDYNGLVYELFGLKTGFDVYIPPGAANTYSCFTEFGEQITVDFRDGKWVETVSGQQTNISKAIGAAIDRKQQTESYTTASA